MITFLSLVTSVKDYIEIVHKLIESDSSFKISNYDELGPIITYLLITLQEFFYNIFTLKWLNNLWDLPIVIPDISSAMISEISILDGYFHNAFNFLDKPLSYGETNLLFSNLEKFSIGLINSLFLFIPTGTSHLITIRRFVMQGLEAGYLAGLGSIFGNIVWITSVIFGFRFFVIPWLSLDIFRYILGFVLLVKYMWDSYNERKMVVTTEPAKQKIFLLNFLLALTEQTSIYPFISNISIGSESSILESFPAQNLTSFMTIHCSYILGLTLGCLSLLHLTCWFWENPAFKIYMWLISSFKVSTSFYYKVLNFTFLYLTMICAISSIPYYGLDYTLTNPLGLVNDDRILYQSETLQNAPHLSFLGTKASDRNTRRNRGRHGRRERWKRRIRKYRTFDASLYDQGVYDLFTMEDLNYGFDRFWLRRKMRNHRVRFRFFPGSWMRSFKKQLAKPRLESYAGPRQEFFRILFEQVYHPSFHVYSTSSMSKNKEFEKNNVKASSQPNLVDLTTASNLGLSTNKNLSFFFKNDSINNSQLKSSIYSNNLSINSDSSIIKENLKVENSTLRKFVRKMDIRIKTSEINNNLKSSNIKTSASLGGTKLYSKRWKHIFSKMSHLKTNENLLSNNKAVLNNFYENALAFKVSDFQSIKKQNSQINISTQDQKILKYRSIYLNKNLFDEKLQFQKFSTSLSNSENKQKQTNLTKEMSTPFTLFHPLKFYQKKQQAFEKKLHYYTPTIFRKFSIENNAPYFRVMMKRYFYYYKPTLRWERTMKVASLRKARRKTPSSPRKIQFPDNIKNNNSLVVQSNIGGVSNSRIEKNTVLQNEELFSSEQKSPDFNNFVRQTIPTHNYTIVGKRASRYRYQIYKDVLQHWYYTPFNRLLLKFDVDLFIKRQPNSHFLTKNEENLLHLRRFLLAEHYNTLRWYTQMEHYRSMKTKIGGTKSFVSGIYNQQFSGTFKKIRHLFAITPSQTNQTILKFDQPLYNEYFNNSKNNYQKNLIIHEELLTNSSTKTVNNQNENRKILSLEDEMLQPQNSLDSTSSMSSTNQLKNNAGNENVNSFDNQKITNNNQLNQQNSLLGQDLLNQSTQILRDYLKITNPIKQAYIRNLLEQKDYVELTNFLYKGKKTRGLKPVTNYSDFLNQEKEYLLTNRDINDLNQLEKLNVDNYLQSVFPTDLWIQLLKKWKRKINDQEFLKNYLQRRVEKREKRKLKKEKNIQLKLQRLETTGFLNNSKKSDAFITQNTTSDTKTSILKAPSELLNENSLTTGIQKALNDGLLTLNNKNLLQSRPFISQKSDKNNSYNSENGLVKKTTSLKDLKYQLFLKKEKELRISLNQLSQILKQAKNQKTTFKNNNKFMNLKNLWETSSFPLKGVGKHISLLTPTKLKDIYKKYQSKSNNFLKTKVFKFFTKDQTRQDNFKKWQAKERSLNKEKRMRKEFKALSKNPFKYDSKNYSKYLDPKSDIPLTVISEPNSNIDQRFFTKNSNLSSLQVKKLKDSIFENSGSKSFENPSDITPSRKKLDYSTSLSLPDQKQMQEGIDSLQNSDKLNNFRETWNKILKNTYSKYFSKKFKRKKSPQRRVRVRKNRAVIKKRTLNDSLKREFKNLRRYNQTLEMNKAQLAAFSFTGEPLLNNQIFKPSPLQRRAKQKKQRFWKQKRGKYAQKLRKYRKRRRSILGKIRILNKQLKRIKTTTDLKNWWWKNFLPNLRATTDSLWQYEKDRQIQQKLLELSVPEILERDKLSYQFSSNSKEINSLQIGDFDYKPLAIPEALRLKNLTTFNNTFPALQDISSNSNLKNNFINQVNSFDKSSKIEQQQTDIISRVAESYLLSNKNNISSSNGLDDFNKKVNQTNESVLTSPIPFYAGWDDSLRKFVVTNRLLSRRESGYEMRFQDPLTNFVSQGKTNKMDIEVKGDIQSQIDKLSPFSSDSLSFTAAPLKGMNTATTLYWQIPFTTYDPDQFFALGMDGFAPLGWRRFQFRHSILKSWLYEKGTPFSTDINKKLGVLQSKKENGNVLHYLDESESQNTNKINLPGSTNYIVKNKTNIRNDVLGTSFKNNTSTLVYKLNEKNSIMTKYDSQASILDKNTRNIYRRLKKRYRRVKKHPRSPVWFPSGPLLNQVLPVHYIYIFYKRSRLPRDRYIKRRLMKSKVQSNLLSGNYSSDGKVNPIFTNIPDFTLRKRVKTKRKYHIKQDLTKQLTLIPRRVKFIGDDSINMRWRPLSRQKLNKPIADLIKEKRLLRFKQRKKELQELNSKQPVNLRVKQLRRRVQRQIIRSVWRYKPRAGGFVWPGDYLKLELVKAPKLDAKMNLQSLSTLGSTVSSQENNKLRSNPIKVKRKKKRSIQEWQIQPKKYLLQKHNYNVIKKKLEKAQRINKIQERTKELSLIL
jgi:threonine/homoserine/homoserine lactone efflux protein